MKKIFYTIVVIIVLSSCHDKEPPATLFELFNTEKRLSGELVVLNKTLGNPYQVVVIDSLLMLYDSDNEHIGSFFNANTGEFLQRFGKIGRGPEEFLMPVEISFDKKNETLNIFERSAGRLTHLKNYSNKEFGNAPQNRVSFTNNQGYTGFARKIGDSTYVASGEFENRFAVFDLSGEILKTTQDYPIYEGVNISDNLLYIAYQNMLEVNSTNNHFASASIYCDNIEFFKFEGNDLILIKRYGFIKPEFVDMSNKDAKMLQPSESNKMGFLDISSDENYIYCLYSGRSINEYKTRSQAFKGEDIFVFDWKGNPITRYKLNEEIVKFTVDSKSKMIYAIAHTPEPVILKYKL
jgi:hypothetical protein